MIVAEVELHGVRELDARAGDGIEVRLLWQPTGDRVFVHLIDCRSAETYLADVAAADALDAFRHPFAYVGDAHFSHPVRAVETRGEEVTT